MNVVDSSGWLEYFADGNNADYAAKLSIETKLPMADSIILATAYSFQADLFTQDNDFAGIPGIKYCRKA